MLSCQHFFVDSERARHKVFNYATENLNAKIVDGKVDHFISNLKCTAKVILAFGFIFEKIEDAEFRYFYAHVTNTLLDCSKLACIKDDLTKLKNILNQNDVSESCS